MNFSDHEWQPLLNAGLVVYDLSPSEMSLVSSVKRCFPAPFAYDCFSLVTAQLLGATLLTGDKLLRRTATSHGLTVHGVLWLVDQFTCAVRFPKSLIVSALESWQNDKTVFIPPDEISARLDRLR